MTLSDASVTTTRALSLAASLPTGQAGVEDRRRAQERREHHLAARGIEAGHEAVPAPVDAGRRLVERRLIRTRSGREVRGVGLADDDWCARRVEREAEPERHVAVGAAEERRVDQPRARRVRRARRTQSTGSNRDCLPARSGNRSTRCCRRRQRHPFRRASSPGRSSLLCWSRRRRWTTRAPDHHERPAGVAAGDVEAVAKFVDSPEATVETARRSARKLFPGGRRGLAKRTGRGFEDEGAIAIDPHR